MGTKQKIIRTLSPKGAYSYKTNHIMQRRKQWGVFNLQRGFRIEPGLCLI